jgi:glycosyltransferase involved in cell wall biosynthesis
VTPSDAAPHDVAGAALSRDPGDTGKQAGLFAQPCRTADTLSSNLEVEPDQGCAPSSNATQSRMEEEPAGLRPGSTPLRILAVTNMYPTPAEPWFGSFVKDQIDALRRLGVSIDVFHFDGRRDWRTYGYAARTVRRLVGQSHFDVLHAHYGLTGAVALCQRTVPVVTTFHGSDSAQVPWQRRVSWFVARRSTPIFVGAENAKRLGLPHALVLPAGVDAALFRPTDRVSARAALGWKQDRVYVLLPGARSNPIKRADLFDRAVALVRRRLPEVRGVSLEGYSRQDVVRVMNAVDVVLLTSDWEGSSVAVKEALACTTPVVSVPVGDVPEVLAELPGCGVVPRDPRALAEAVLNAVAVRDEALRRRALDFSYERVAMKILDVYHCVQPGLGRSRPSAPDESE